MRLQKIETIGDGAKGSWGWTELNGRRMGAAAGEAGAWNVSVGIADGPRGEPGDVVVDLRRSSTNADPLLPLRRSMYWGGTVLPSGSLVPAPFPGFMDGQWPDVLERVAETGVYDQWTGGTGKGKERGANHCLVNEYLPGQGIMPHTDGPAYLPCTSTLSLGSHTILSLRSKPAHLQPPSASSPPSSTTASGPQAAEKPAPEVEKIDIFLPPRSLVVLTGELYASWLHGIQPLKADPLELLKACANWEGWWDWQLESAAEGAGEGDGQEKSEERKKDVDDRRKLVEAGHGWAREKRVSLTCRRVQKVRRIKLV
ncbi:hypothetical protein JCM1840_004917 [Sporobolomyces johnsonii]